MSTRQRVIDYHIARLKHKSVEIRKEAIGQLVLLHATEALEALREVFEQDEDPDVRRAAQDAGRTLWQTRSRDALGNS